MRELLTILAYVSLAHLFFYFFNWFFFRNISLLQELKEVEILPAVAAGTAANGGAPAQPNRLVDGEGYDN